MINPIPKKPWLNAMRNQWYCDYCDTPLDLSEITQDERMKDLLERIEHHEKVIEQLVMDVDKLKLQVTLKEDPYEKMVKEPPWCYAHDCNNDWCRCK